MVLEHLSGVHMLCYVHTRVQMAPVLKVVVPAVVLITAGARWLVPTFIVYSSCRILVGRSWLLLFLYIYLSCGSMWCFCKEQGRSKTRGDAEHYMQYYSTGKAAGSVRQRYDTYVDF